MYSKNTNIPNCPYCESAKAAKNGTKANNQQNYKCGDCGKQFQDGYKYKGANPAVQKDVEEVLLANGGIRSTARAFGISQVCVLNKVKKLEPKKEWEPKQDK